ncbi:hypothetical protein EST38_g8631 [Candolleomyces aberdarensis]|uniref:Uncharacterized protein n=1 Tax=Candolleomyces aberdarensis TaxID=2316362 RepID=A0A4Q2DE54_9AGAR|nr:hypothetical protein EST38_g8631 [Candolleomyces aberdarensis]
MAHVRTHGNILLLGPFFLQKLDLMQQVIDEPALWLSASINPKTALLEGDEFTEWTTMVIAAVHRLVPTLPHVIGALIAFLKGTKATFQRFTKEFHEGGDIAQMSDNEKENLFVASTNDLNEGALGKVRLSKRARPNQTLLSHNSRQLYQNNGTADFAQSKLQSHADQLFVRKVARQQQVSGRSRKIRERHIEHKKHRVLENRRWLVKRAEAERNRLAQLEATRKALVLDNSEIDKLKVPGLDKQLRFHREEEKKRNSSERIPALTGLNKERKQEELKKAVSRWLTYVGEAMDVDSDEDLSDSAVTQVAMDFSDCDEL